MGFTRWVLYRCHYFHWHESKDTSVKRNLGLYFSTSSKPIGYTPCNACRLGYNTTRRNPADIFLEVRMPSVPFPIPDHVPINPIPDSSMTYPTRQLETVGEDGIGQINYPPALLAFSFRLAGVPGQRGGPSRDLEKLHHLNARLSCKRVR